ncbi:FAD-dependent monooxygenase [Streptomyces sp. NPDC059477]|uniref:FAD-dependent monooxygenase n=1 Tax=Streptomyces sp. NPDC059477 TaxID=3346847 RepID=UPI00369BED99
MVDVTIVGAGPVGLWAAGELARRNIEVVVLEKLDRPSPHSKALTIHPRTLEVLGQRGIVGEAIGAGIQLPSGHFANLDQRMDFRPLDTPYPFTLLYPQEDTEILLERTARELGAVIRRGHEVLGVEDNGSLVSTRVRGDGSTYVIESGYLIGADGARSLVRHAAGIAFEGTSSSHWGFLGDVVLDEPPGVPVYSKADEHGGLMVVPLPKDGLYRIVGGSPLLAENNELTFEQFRAAVVDVAGTDFGMRDPVWLSRYGDAAKIAASYRAGRVFLAGDAAHIHLPAGGVGMNVGIQDAANLAWRLADVIEGRAPESYLDRYDAERRPVGLDLLLATRAQAALRSYTTDGLALRALLAELIATVPEFSRALAERLSGFAVRYALPGHPLAGSRAPDLPLAGAEAGLFDALREARPVVVAAPGVADGTTAAQLHHHDIAVRTLARQERGAWAGVTAALIRPDGYVAWATEADERRAHPELLDAAARLRPGTR